MLGHLAGLRTVNPHGLFSSAGMVADQDDDHDPMGRSGGTAFQPMLCKPPNFKWAGPKMGSEQEPLSSGSLLGLHFDPGPFFFNKSARRLKLGK